VYVVIGDVCVVAVVDFAVVLQQCSFIFNFRQFENTIKVEETIFQSFNDILTLHTLCEEHFLLL
jgi:hypothetical protein